MSDEGEKTCPLCAEEMDLTDQQLKPCKCGYDVCVWCWHHIMDMAEKDNTEGRCPACRTPYNKEKIVGTASKCERLVAEMNVEKKHKLQKGKTKTSEGRKQLSSVRVIQRNLVYIVGLPLNLADEDLLQRKEYFGQYGKVQKVSISRTAAGAIQHFANNTCSVYITYSKEDEAVRSIQAVHGFVLEGRPLRACFGTTKYCHAWLRSMPCTNPDCLYLHEFGSQEDSFTKDEIISEYTRGRVQQVTGAINETQRRSGNILPPPADDYSNNSTSSWGKPISKNTTNDPANSMKGSPPNSSPRRSVVLPAAASWGTRTSNSQPLSANLASPNGPSKQKADTYTTLTFSTTVASPSLHATEILKKGSDSSQESHISAVKSEPNHTKMVPSFSKSSSNPVQENELDVSNEEIINNLSSEMSSLSTGSNQRLVSDLGNEVEEVGISKTEADLLSFNDQRLRDPEVVTHTSYAQNISSPRLNSSLDYSYSHRQPYASVNGSLDPPFSDQNSLNLPAVNGHSSNLVGNSLFETKRDHNTSLDLGENSIISNILSMDFDPWDESLTSPQNLAKLLGDSDKQEGSNRVSGSRKAQNSNQSRFSFAREDECVDQGSNFAPTFSDYGPGLNRSFSREFVSNRDVYPGQFSDGNGFSSFNFEESDRAHSSISSNKISAVSRTQVSAPPGFLGPSRAPPPGFTSHERMEHTYDNLSGNNHMFETSSLLRKVHQAPSPVYNNGSLSDLEFMDPAILAVGGRVNSNFPSFENNNNNLQLLVQRSFTQQNQRYTGRNDAYGVNSRIIEQSLPNNRSHYQQTSFQQPRSSMISSNGHWDGWNEVQNGNDIAMAEILRNERVGFNKYYSGYEDAKFRLSGSGDVYNRTFGL